MSEPLTKDKLKCGCSSQLIETRDIKNCPTRYLSEKDLKSALEEFEFLINEQIAELGKSDLKVDAYDPRIRSLVLSKSLMKKTFPAIYEKEKGDDENGK
jgi:hypothetical protein